MLLNAAKCQGTAFTVSVLLRENQKEHNLQYMSLEQRVTIAVLCP